MTHPTRPRLRLLGASLALLVGLGLTPLRPAVAEPEAPTAIPAGCTLSPYHVIYDDEADTHPFGLSWNPSEASPADPSNGSFQLRSAAAGLTNSSAHTLYEGVYFIGWTYLSRDYRPIFPNYAMWLPDQQWFQTDQDKPGFWTFGWEPRDTSTLGAVVTLAPGDAAGSPLPVTLVRPDQLGFGNRFESEATPPVLQTRPGYLLPEIAPGQTGQLNQVLRIERPKNSGAYSYQVYRYLSARTCLPTPTISAPSQPAPATASGTGDYVGDTIVVRDQDGTVLGSTTVNADLTWSLTLAAGADPLTTLTVTETDEFGFTGQASTPVPQSTPEPTTTPTPDSTPSSPGTASTTASPTSSVTTSTPDPSGPVTSPATSPTAPGVQPPVKPGLPNTGR